jgi:hypothetical protein
MRGRVRAVALGVSMAVVATVAAASAAPVAAAGPVVQLGRVMLGDGEVLGAAPDSSLKVTIRQQRGGRTIAADTAQPDPSGFFGVALKPVRAGDRLVLKRGADVRTVVVPALELGGDAATDQIAGRIPTHHLATQVAVSDVVGTFSLGGRPPVPVVSGAHGRFHASAPGLSGADRLELSWDNATGDTFSIETAMAAAQVRNGSAAVTAWGRAGQTVSVELRSGNGTIRGTARVRIRQGGTSGTGTFRKAGAAVKVHAGDQLRIGGRAMLLTLGHSLDAAPTSLSATCFPDQDWVAGEQFGSGAISYLDDGTADGTGTVTGSWLGPLASGAKVILLCENARGSTQELVAAVP